MRLILLFKIVDSMHYLIWLCFFISVSSFSAPPSTFNQAKKIAGQIFANHHQTLYCQCQYENKSVDLKSCGMESASTIKRAHRVEWEHMMPAEQFGKHFKCWREALCEKNGKPYKGRACCEKIDPVFRQMEAELYNLWPSVGLVNQARSNYRFAALEQRQPFYGCSIAIDKKARRVEPPDDAKGTIARANLFIAHRYGISLSDSQKKLFLAWSAQFPPTAWEVEWAKKTADIEGYDNPYVSVFADNQRIRFKTAA